MASHSAGGNIKGVICPARPRIIIKCRAHVRCLDCGSTCARANVNRPRAYMEVQARFLPRKSRVRSLLSQ